MSKPEELFYIREIAGVCGVSINALRFYEAKGLLTPAFTDPDSGYRYYSRENLHRLRTMLHLRDAGLSLREIRDYLDGNMDIGAKMEELEARRALIGRVIEDLKIRATVPGDLTVHETALPERLCLCRTIRAGDGAAALAEISVFYAELIRGGIRMSRAWPEFCEYPDDGLLKGKFPVTDFTVTACVPVEPGTAPPDAVRYPAGGAVEVRYRGGYYGLWKAYEALRRCMETRGCAPAGHPQEIYLGIDPQGVVQLDDPEYITRVIVPVRSL
jgi:DNA-binding transcriptional MerR regulator